VKENKYDDPVFFEKYAAMSRSRLGLDGAGEWETLSRLLPDLRGKRVLDLGCGYGWHCRYAAEAGAREVVGVDISRKMLEEAEKRTRSRRVRYLLLPMEDVNFPTRRFDLVLSSLAFHYIEGYEELIRNIFTMLRPRGSLVFSVEHPVFTAAGHQDWHYDGQGKILHFPVDNYFKEGERSALFLGERVVKYHRTLTSWLGVLTSIGFRLDQVVEPKPPESMLDQPGMKDELRRPQMLIVSAKKPGRER